MKCECGASDCTAEFGFDSYSGLLMVEREDKGPIAVYLTVEQAVTLAQQLRRFVLNQMERDDK